MPFRGIKINIAFNIAIILLMAMLLINIVVVITVRKNLTIDDVDRKFRLLAALERHLPRDAGDGAGADLSKLKLVFEDHLNAMDGARGVVRPVKGKAIHLGPANRFPIRELESITRIAMMSGEKKARINGSPWNIFLGSPDEILVAAPYFNGGRVVAGIGVAQRAGGVHGALRQSQKVVLWYIIINIFVFSFLVLYRISRLFLDPVKRLSRRAEVYKVEDGVFFPVQKDANEIKSLSNALNSMLERISEDKKTLRKTVRSLKKANLELESAQKEVIRAEKLASVGRLSAGIAHEIGNPIGIVLGYLELLKQNGLAGMEKDEYIARSVEEINRINKIIRQLLDFSRPSTDCMINVSVHEILHGVVDVVRVQPFMSKIHLTLDLTTENDRVCADPDQLKQIFLNLVINSADAIQSRQDGAEGELAIKSEIGPGPAMDGEAPSERGEPSRGMLKITFIDNGVGLPGEHLENIFDPFFSTKEPGKGTGLGLAVSYTIIDRIGGAIEADNVEGQGAVFTVRLPLARENDRGAG